jgi:hypothetical protein
LLRIALPPADISADHTRATQTAANASFARASTVVLAAQRPDSSAPARSLAVAPQPEIPDAAEADHRPDTGRLPSGAVRGHAAARSQYIKKADTKVGSGRIGDKAVNVAQLSGY